MDCLQSCERTSLLAEGQLERAMGWACGGPNSSSAGSTSTKMSGIPPEFHDHIKRRRQILWETREKTSDIVKFCMSVLEFEASRDGSLLIPGEPYPFRTDADSKTWQQAYLNALTRLDVTYHSFTRTEQEWKLAQSTMEAASSSFYTATNELGIASHKAKSASGDLQNTVLSMRDCAYEASVALSAFTRVSRSHTALTSECGSMLEEVLAITEDLHDVCSLGKEAAAVHHSLMEDLSKANAILLPLESVLSKDVAAMTDAMARERETKTEISHIHGQAIYQSYCLRIREACQSFKPLVPSLTLSVKGLYSMMTRLARTASLHAGNLHKALEGIGESQEVNHRTLLYQGQIQVVILLNLMTGTKTVSLGQTMGTPKIFSGISGLNLQDKGWISPPDSICSSSSASGITSTEASVQGSLNDPADSMEQLSRGCDSRKATGYVNSSPFSQTDIEEISNSGKSESNSTEANVAGTGSVELAVNEPRDIASPCDESLEVPADSMNSSLENREKFEVKDGLSSSNKVKIEDEHHEATGPNIHSGTRIGRGKNAYALSVLRRVEMKIEGRDISDSRETGIAEQVDYLLKQATSVDNLCNMYEGWTPWI
ncbi:Serine/threonine protein kinase [Quillaja saponaria]|uniref:Serine/threonine protein kinase n=1 Tax=Quillaja saponaria TaxID=32244 RepID=A0AAD7M0A7_QUISA|nr:Serine/threonine protein kinase [Quillaja saponaria]